MSRCPRAVAFTVLWLLGGVAPARAQIQPTEDPEQAPVHLGAFAFAPVVRVSNIGRDSNVYDTSEDNHPQGDVTAVFSPRAEAWFLTPHVHVNGRADLNVFYYKDLTELRSSDTNTAGHFELVLGRLTPYVEGSFLNAGHRQGIEVDALARVHDESARAGVEVAVGGKTSVGVYAGRTRLAYQGETRYYDVDLSRALNHTGTITGAGVHYEVTPLTSVGIYVERQQDRFDASPDRNADSLRVMPEVEFKPLALVSGHAAVGFRRSIFRNGDVPEFKGLVASADLAYVLRVRTQFSVNIRRDLDYSYLDLEHDYLSTGFTATLTERLGEGWDVRGSIGRFNLAYERRGAATATGSPEVPNEVSVIWGSDVGYRVGHTRIGLNVDHASRQSDVSLGRGYSRLRVGSSIEYTF